MTETTFLQSYVVPVCTFEQIGDQAHLRSIQGTAFLINDWGIFLTAAHVLTDAQAHASLHGQEVGVCGKSNGGTGEASIIARVFKHEIAPFPYDVAIGATQYSTQGPLRLGLRQLAPWQEVATLGYPLSASLKDDDDALWMSIKAHRGYVVRTTLPRDMAVGDHPNGIELSFLLSPGMSGSPIFTIPDEIVVGIGVGSFGSELTEHSIEEVDENGRTFKERRIRIEQFGFAHDITSLLDWRPAMLSGLSLLQAAQATKSELEKAADVGLR
ncbi:MAG: serine protease [Sphingomicrobium sp.]